jgi:uncharacterized protein (TIGR02246 family)
MNRIKQWRGNGLATMSALALAMVALSATVLADDQADIVAVEKSTFKAWASGDMKAYGDTMHADAVATWASGNRFNGKQAVVGDLSTDPCEVKSYDLADIKVRMLSPDIAVLSYRLSQDATCKSIGKLAAQAFVTTVYHRQAGKWRWVSYQETPTKK